MSQSGSETTTPATGGFIAHLRASIETMSPGYFSMVMATGCWASRSSRKRCSH